MTFDLEAHQAAVSKKYRDLAAVRQRKDKERRAKEIRLLTKGKACPHCGKHAVWEYTDTDDVLDEEFTYLECAICKWQE